jgi:hypothetical protein
VTRLGLIAAALLMTGCSRHVSGVAVGPAGACTWKMDAYERACVASDRTGGGEWETRKLLCGSDAYLCGAPRTCHCSGEGVSCPKAAGVWVSLKSRTCRVGVFPPENGMCPLVVSTTSDTLASDGTGEIPFGFLETDVCGHRFACKCESFSIPDVACDASMSRNGDHCVLTQRLDPYEYNREVANGTSVTVCGKSYTCTL